MYPFFGVSRWALLPALITAAGAVAAIADAGLTGNLAFGPLFAGAVGGALAFPIGAALALGRRPGVAVAAGFVLGALSLSAAAALLTALIGMPVTFNTSRLNMGANGVEVGILVLAHHLYLRARRLGPRGVAGGVVLYAVAAMAAARLAELLNPEVSMGDVLRQGGVGALTQWGAMEVAVRVSERAAPAPAPPAPEA